MSAFRARHAEGGGSGLGVYSLSYGSATTVLESSTFDDFVVVSQQVSGRFVARADKRGAGRVARWFRRAGSPHGIWAAVGANCNIFHVCIPRTEFEATVAKFTGAISRRRTYGSHL
ncbi:hypothetical protein A5775_17055 [Mycobacterium sp. 852002-10029_SCH5224772]|nr:hypothetical protein A5775_17055 [Mycobacterium sp. 852002-10029_SCH5224772]